jgi:ATP/maltotriose-dependent transcriptional regulator MalT
MSQLDSLDDQPLIEAQTARELEILEQLAANRSNREVGHKDDLGLALACLAVAARGLGDMAGARQHLSHALEIAQESGAVLPLLWALPAMALLLADEGENERAVETYALASRYLLVAESRWFEDVAGREISPIAATLPPDARAAVEERGRAQDLEATAAKLLSELAR